MLSSKKIPFKNTLVLAAACFIIPIASFAQLTQPHRYERKQKNSDDYFHVISLKEQGIALFRERDKYKGSNKIWELILLDTALLERKAIEIEMKERFKMVGYEVTPTHIHLLYRTGESTKNDFELATVNLNGEEEERHSIKSDLDFKLTHFVVAANSLILGGYVNKDPAILLYDLATKHIKVVPGFLQKDSELVDLRVNQNNTFNVVLVDRSNRDDRTLLFKTFDSSGELLLEDLVPIDEDKSLQTGITSTLEREDLIVVGNWGERNSKNALGFYAITVDPFQEQKINFVAFGSLTHYLDYLKPKRAVKVAESTKDELQAGRLPRFSNSVVPYKIMEHKDGFLLLAEVYSSTSSASSVYAGPYYGSYPYAYNPYGFYPYGPGSYPGSSRMYRPYPYTPSSSSNFAIEIHETVIISFDANGNVGWDQSLVLDDLKIESSEQISDFTMNNDTIIFLYKKESELKYKRIGKSESVSEEQTQKIKASDPMDEIRTEKDGDGFVRHWYGDSFFVWGYQTIRNSISEDRVRDVFYINKVVAK
jgi:hypothetical protein